MVEYLEAFLNLYWSEYPIRGAVWLLATGVDQVMLSIPGWGIRILCTNGGGWLGTVGLL